MLYKKNKEAVLSDALFRSPTAEYRGTPFWAWNGYLEKKELARQIGVFKEMGLGGFHMHVRTGLENEYLSDAFMDLVSFCVDKAKENEMLAWLYDEDRWSSGAAGGIVTKDVRYRARHLLFTPFEKAAADGGTLLACYDIVLDDEGFLSSYRRIGEADAAEGNIWYAYLKIATPDSWFNNQTYVDTLNEEAIKRFVEVTHERYKKTVGSEFDKTVPAIFTDEPQFSRKRLLNNSFDQMNIEMPWTDRVPALYKETYGEDIFATLPELFWDLPDGRISLARYRYHDLISELFAHSFADTVGAWCKENNIALTGHMMEEPSLRSQTAALGEAMRSYRGFGLPGIDMLCNSHEFTTAKQAQSAAHQFGKEGVLSELYGVTAWDCDFRIYKHQGDWQAALGVTVRVPHLSWYSMKGEAKRDYPASIHDQSPWYKEYRVIEDHFARVNTALTRGKPVVKVAVIHPVESFWLHWGPNDKSALLRESLDDRFWSVTDWLLKGSIDFDFVSESLLPSQCRTPGAPLQVGEMQYDVVIVPGCETLRGTTCKLLSAFRDAGGKLVFMGDAPTLCDAVPSDKGKQLAARSIRIDFSRAALLECLEENRTVTVRRADGALSDRFVYQLRQDNDCRWLFLANAQEPFCKDVDGGQEIQICLQGIYTPVVYDTQTGDTAPMEAFYRGGQTIIKTKLYGYDSLLLKLTEGRAQPAQAAAAPELPLAVLPQTFVDYELTEPNVLVLDYAQFKLDDEPMFRGPEEILRLDNLCRAQLGLPGRSGHIVQPYITGKVPSTHRLTLRFTFESEIAVTGAKLALEDAALAEITLNGVPVANTPDGFFVDRCIGTVALPPLQKGKNVLEVILPFGKASNTEAMFILGAFGVDSTGRMGKLTPLPDKLAFGDLTRQGFPFYGGCVKYRFSAAANDGTLVIRASDYRGALIKVRVDGDVKGHIIYPPYALTVGGLTPGEHKVELELFLHRFNSFGPLHMVNEAAHWHGPNAWRTDGADWSYEYVLRKTGILAAPYVSAAE